MSTGTLFWPGVTIGPIVETIADPVRGHVEDALDTLDGPARRGTSWMQRAAGRSQDGRVTRTQDGNVPQFEGRACCYAHLYPLASRVDLELPFETACPECARRFRVTLGLVSGRGRYG